MKYKEFLKQKMITTSSSGFEIDKETLNPMLFDFQKDIVKWCLRKGKSAIWAECGLGKTPMQLEWAKLVYEHTGGNILILAPLAVSSQTVREGVKFGIDVNIATCQDDVKHGINITNYEKMDKFVANEFDGIVLDESSILKHFTSKTRIAIIDNFNRTPYKLACTATPAPNDYMELGNHAEFLGVMSRTEMLSMFFVHDGGDTAKWRLKGHAEDKFWEWVAGWAVTMRKPSDLGYEDGKFKLPELKLYEHVVESPESEDIGQISFIPELAETLMDRRQARRESLESRVAKAAELANNSDEQWLVWCDLNAESEALTKAIHDAVEVKGSDKNEHKADAMLGFANGDIRCLVSKPSICGFGMNFQNCSNMIFVGLSDSYEQFYQAVRRCWRFGQKNEVNAHIVISEREGLVKANIERKEADAERMADEMVKHTQTILTGEIRGTAREVTEYEARQKMILPEWLGVAM